MYNPEKVRSFYDAYAEREWNRHERRPHDRVSVHIHTHYLEQFIRPGMRVLDAGAGPGKYTLELIRLGARIVAGDISPVQLELHRQKTEGATGPGTIESRDLLDITDLAVYPDNSFDATVCYGGPLSYTYERAMDALAELLRVTNLGGPLLFSGMSLWGAFRIQFADIYRQLIPALGVERVYSRCSGAGILRRRSAVIPCICFVGQNSRTCLPNSHARLRWCRQ